MNKITENQHESLVDSIYSTLMNIKIMDSEGNEIEMGMGEMGEARDEAERIVKEWAENNNIEIIE